LEQAKYYFEVLLANFRATTWLEWIAVVTAVAQVLLARANKASNYVFGAVSTTITIILYTKGALYAEAALNVYYLVMSIYGLWHWRGGGQRTEVTVTFSSPRDWGIATAIAAGTLLVGVTALRTFSNSQVPLWDAGAAALAFAGMWLLARRKVENWLWLNASNAVALPLLFFKGYIMLAALTGFLFIVAIFGYFDWRRLARRASVSRP
jgi:nicotinamide mononucleotide transporter